MTIGHKKLQLVEQAGPMKVYVNPNADGPDEWETPPGSGFRLLVGSLSLSPEDDPWDIPASLKSKSSVPGGA